MGLVDWLNSNNQKADAAVEVVIARAKDEGPNRSALRLRDLLQLPLHEETVR